MTLTDEEKVEVFDKMKRIYADFSQFDTLIASNLKRAIEESNSIPINHLTTSKVVERYYDIKAFKSKEEKSVLSSIKVIFKSCYVLIFSYKDTSREQFWQSTDQLVDHYPEFQGVDKDELKLLLKFRNFMHTALFLIPASKNKSLLLNIAARLEGAGKEYVTGSGQKKEVDRRVAIYEQEGSIKAETRSDRKRKPPEDASVKRKNASVVRSNDYNACVKVAKRTHLPPEKLEQISKKPLEQASLIHAGIGDEVSPGQIGLNAPYFSCADEEAIKSTTLSTAPNVIPDDHENIVLNDLDLFHLVSMSLGLSME